jgi:hypothetical protein
MAGNQIQDEVVRRGFDRQFPNADASFLVAGDGELPLRGTVSSYSEDIEICWHAGEHIGRGGEKAV